MAIHIVTDSMASIPPETARALGITVVPLIVFFGVVLGAHAGPGTAAVAVISAKL